ncbi:hypothetical protein QBC38DRAFT_529284 [Podospora fimiseda]|uniref:Uncharacterized protein n=1 Tax=Podospora fimiseda TaxID=252190 RepID=A0AAN7BMU9_9PEZI|nr:hypothetical protein QBC38DRAFT_529284 [Podospora fimiseda]
MRPHPFCLTFRAYAGRFKPPLAVVVFTYFYEPSSGGPFPPARGDGGPALYSNPFFSFVVIPDRHPYYILKDSNNFGVYIFGIPASLVFGGPSKVFIDDPEAGRMSMKNLTVTAVFVCLFQVSFQKNQKWQVCCYNLHRVRVQTARPTFVPDSMVKSIESVESLLIGCIGALWVVTLLAQSLAGDISSMSPPSGRDRNSQSLRQDFLASRVFGTKTKKEGKRVTPQA